MKRILPILLALFLFLPGVVFAQTVFSVSVSASFDDVQHHLTPLHVFAQINGYNHAGDFASNQYDWASGMRFTNVTVPQGAAISSAFLKLRAQASWGTGWTTKIDGEATDDAAQILNDGTWDTRVRTSSSVVWNPPIWTPTIVYSSTDIATVIQEIINRPLWVSGNDINLFWEDNQGVGWQTQKGLRADSFETPAGTFPELVVTFVPIPPITPTTIFAGWIAFIGNGLAILIVAIFCGVFLWIVKAPPLMMLICGWLSLILLFELGVVSTTVVLVALVGFVGAMFFKVVLGSGSGDNV